MSVNEKMTAIANTIREKTGQTEPLTLDDMPLGINEACWNYHSYGKQEERNAFWDVLQNYGNEDGAVYYYAFTYNQYNDDTYNPLYDIICSTGTRPGQCLFFNNTVITDTKVPITVKGNSALSMFSGASSLVTIRKLTVNKNTELTTIFRDCDSLVNLTMGGTIGQNVDIHWSENLNKKSIESIINALSASESGLTVTFSKTAVNKAFGIDIDDESTWTFEWLELRGTKSKWTFNYV